MPEECLFCKIVKGEVPSKKIYEDSISLAFLDINPRNPGHTLVIPKKHYENLFDMPAEDAGRLFERVKRIAVMAKNGTQAQGLNVVQSNGKIAGQAVPHIHFHIIPRFMNEGPPSIEAFLPVKRLDDESMNKIANNIKNASAEVQTKEEWQEESDEEEEKEKPKKEKKQRKAKDEEEEFEEINFDF